MAAKVTAHEHIVGGIQYGDMPPGLAKSAVLVVMQTVAAQLLRAIHYARCACETAFALACVIAAAFAGKKSFQVVSEAIAASVSAGQWDGQGAAKKSDAKAWEGAQTTAFSSEGYKAGDKAAWEAHLKARTERGQNEYSRTTPK